MTRGVPLVPDACRTFGTTISDFGPATAVDYSKAF